MKPPDCYFLSPESQTSLAQSSCGILDFLLVTEIHHNIWRLRFASLVNSSKVKQTNKKSVVYGRFILCAVLLVLFFDSTGGILGFATGNTLRHSAASIHFLDSTAVHRITMNTRMVQSHNIAVVSYCIKTSLRVIRFTLEFST